MSRPAIVFLAAVLAATAALAQSALAKKAKARQSVGVVAASYDEFTVQKVGFTVFGNERHTVAIKNWKANDLVARKTVALLNKRFRAERISAPGNAFAPLQKLSVFDSYAVAMGQILRKLAGSRKFDYIVLALPGGGQIGNTNQYASGLTIVSLGGLISANYVAALTRFYIFDGRTFERITEVPSTIGQRILFTTIHGPHREVDDSWVPSPPEKAAADPRLKKAALSLLDQSLAVTVPRLLTSD